MICRFTCIPSSVFTTILLWNAVRNGYLCHLHGRQTWHPVCKKKAHFGKLLELKKMKAVDVLLKAWSIFSRSFKVPQDKCARIQDQVSVSTVKKKTFPSIVQGKGWDTVGRWWSQDELCSGPEHVHCSHHILPADGAFAHALAAFGARDHVSALQKNTVNGWVHTDLTKVLLTGNPRPCVYAFHGVRQYVLQVFLVVVKACDSLHQFPLLTAAFVVDKVPRQNLL